MSAPATTPPHPHQHPSTHTKLLSVFLRYTVPLLALFAAGPLAYAFTNGLTSPTGDGNTTFLLSGSMAHGLIAMVVSLGIAIVFTAIGSALLGAKGGLISAGYVLGWAAWGLGDLTMVWRHQPDLSVMSVVTLAVEGAVLALACLAMLVVATKADRHHTAPLRDLSARAFLKEFTSVGALVPVLAATAAALVVAVLIAQSGLKGQTQFAALVAGIAAAVAAHSATSADTPHPYAPFVGVALAAVVAPLVAIFQPGLGRLPLDAATGDLIGLLRVGPADWTVALLIGVPVGLGWTGTFTPHHEISG